MDEPKSLDSLFKEKIFRIPDYQRGYAWQKTQLTDFWEDLVNLSDDRSHYTGVLTLKEISPREISASDNENWLVEDHSYKVYNIVDGQQRLTTFVLFLQAFIDFIKSLDDFAGKEDREVFITDSLRLTDVIERYLYKKKPSGDHFKTYKFGYDCDNPSYKFLRYNIFKESGSPHLRDTFYTLNLQNAHTYFYGQLKSLYEDHGMDELRHVYKKLTKQFLFNEYIIKDEFDVYVAFETMNNRGKRLSDLELLKNRLIYLTTLYSENELDPADRRSLREAINTAWKEIYDQLGRNKKHPLNDDDFLKAHWILYFQYSRKRGKYYIDFLLNDQFSPHRIYEKLEREVALETPEELIEDLSGIEQDESDEEHGLNVNVGTIRMSHLQPTEVRSYVDSLRECAVHWFTSHNPRMSGRLNDDEIEAIERLNRVGIGYFRPLVMSILKNEPVSTKRVEVFNEIERFIFVIAHLSNAKRNHRDTVFHKATRQLNNGKISTQDIVTYLRQETNFCFHSDGTLDEKDFYSIVEKKFKHGGKRGFYDWSGLKYFLYEYELSLLAESRQQKVSWDDLKKRPRDHVSIEHILPQKPTESWQKAFSQFDETGVQWISGSLGNLLLLSSSINSALQNYSFLKKRDAVFEKGEKVRNGYADGSHSEIEVSREPRWTCEEIERRGMRLLKFMEKRWDIKFRDEATMKKLLFLSPPSPPIVSPKA